jgi:hypothetical protein
MKTYTITIKGQTHNDIEIALQDILRKIKLGYLSDRTLDMVGNVFYSFESKDSTEKRDYKPSAV